MSNDLASPFGRSRPKSSTAHVFPFTPKKSWQLALALLLSSCCSPTLRAGDSPAKTTDEVVTYFDSGKIPVLKLVLSSEKQDSLRKEPREYVAGSLHEDGQLRFASVGIKLKGSAGSFQEFDDLPGLTLNVDKYKKGQRFHGMKKFHLNNSAQDATLLNEWLGSEFFRAAGYVAPRVGHARVMINDRDLGVYVLREGFDSPFLHRAFPGSGGNLYDGGFIQDIDSELEMDAGSDLNNRADLLALAIACSEEEPAVRWKGISERLDIDRFVTFMALERLCGHWDGYTLNMNNYRLYFPPKGRGMFIPHGMDQLFGDPNAGLYDHASPLLSAAVMQNDAWRDLYHERLKKLLPLFQPINRWHAKMDEVQRRLEAVLKPLDPEKAKAHNERVQELKQLLAERAKNVARIVKDGPKKPMSFDKSGILALKDWSSAPDGEDAKLEEVEFDGVPCYKVSHKKFGDHSSSWQRRVLLPRGEYRIEARLRTENVIPIPDNQGRGAGVRYSANGRTDGLAGNTKWQKVSCDFSVREDQREVELSLELRARNGSAWFDRSSLRLTKIK
jgi:spore coat protein H